MALVGGTTVTIETWIFCVGIAAVAVTIYWCIHHKAMQLFPKDHDKRMKALARGQMYGILSFVAWSIGCICLFNYLLIWFVLCLVISTFLYLYGLKRMELQ